MGFNINSSNDKRNEMNSHIIVDNALHVYKCKHCGMESEPPWMTPPPDIAQDARDHFIAEHKNCKLSVAQSGEELLSLGSVTKVGEQTGE
jgi:hypothetical protein